MTKIEEYEKLVDQTEVPEEMATELSLMDDEEFQGAVDGLLATLKKGEEPERGMIYACAVLQEQKQRRLLHEEHIRLQVELVAKEKEIAEKKRVLAGLEQMYSDLKVQEKLIKGETIKVGRNEPCPCGSGKKYKHCCGRA